MSFLGRLTQSFTRERNALAPIGGGEFSESASSVTFKGLIEQRRASETLIGGRETALSEHRLYYPPGTDILSPDTIVDAAGNRYDCGTPNDVHNHGRVGQVDLRLKTDKVP